MQMGPLRVAAVVLATLIALTIVLAFVAAFLGACRMAEFSAKFNTERAPKCNISELYPFLKTGDLLFFTAAIYTPANTVFIHTFYTHAAIVLREGDLVYLAETQPGLGIMPDPDHPGIEYRMDRSAVVTPLLTRLKYYTGSYYILRLSHPLDPAREEALKQEAERLWAVRYPYPSLAQIALGALGAATPSRHCFQHVAHLLDVARLTPLGREGLLQDAGFSEVCTALCEVSGRPLPGGYTYGSPVQILYDVGAVDPRP